MRSPQLARVTPHHFQIAELALRQIAEAGHRRVAWVTRGDSEESDGAVSLAAHVLAQRGVAITLVPFRGDAGVEEFAACAPRRGWDAILVPDEKAADEVAAIARVSVAARSIFTLNRAPDGRWAGVFQNPQTVGQLAVEALARSIQGGERGPSAYAAVTMIEGVWVNPACRRFNEDVPLAASTASA
ncbi:MAG: hypothetical protein QM747_13775 [Nocardioides sp.]